jgi:hypothetical protein
MGFMSGHALPSCIQRARDFRVPAAGEHVRLASSKTSSHFGVQNAQLNDARNRSTKGGGGPSGPQHVNTPAPAGYGDIRAFVRAARQALVAARSEKRPFMSNHGRARPGREHFVLGNGQDEFHVQERRTTRRLASPQRLVGFSGCSF